MSFHSLAAVFGVASVISATAVAGDDRPKIGAFSMKRMTTGSYRLVPVGNGENYLEIREEVGKVQGDGLLSNMTTRCFGTGETINNIRETRGFCVDRDADGDQVIYRTKTEKRSQDKSSVRGSGDAMLGTGKYAGIEASYVVSCEESGPYSGYTSACEGQGSYILP